MTTSTTRRARRLDTEGFSSKEAIWQELLESHIEAEANAALAVGSLYSVFLGFGAAALLFVLQMWGAVDNMVAPMVWTCTGGVVSFFVYYLARRNRLRGRTQYAVFGVFMCLPTLLFVAGAFTMPAGAATYITGPASYLYFFLIVVSGFTFNPRLAVFSGFVAAAGYQVCFLLAHPKLVELVHISDKAMAQDFVGIPIYTMKSAMMIVTGFGVAALANIARRLVLRLTEEEREKRSISKLFGMYVSDEVKDKIIAEKAALKGERKRVVILFSDIRGFSTMTESADPAAIVSQLNEYFDGMVDAIRINGGVVDKFIGDAIMAVFGGLQELDNSAESALRAGRQMLERLEELNDRWRDRGEPPIAIGVGMQYGEVIQGNIGSSERIEFTVIGDAVNTAARLEGLTKDHDYGILLGGELYERLTEAKQAGCASLGSVKVKGRASDVEIYGAN